METLTHLRTSAVFLNKEDHIHSKLVIDKFIESCLNLDASIFEPFMDENDVFQDLGKYKFLAELKELFDYSRFKTHHNFGIRLTNEKCLSCVKGKPVVNFQVMLKKNSSIIGEFGFLIDKEKGILKDIYRCNMYRETHGWWLEPEGLPSIRVPQADNKKFNVENRRSTDNEKQIFKKPNLSSPNQQLSLF